MDRQFFMKNLWLWKFGMPEKQPKEKLKLEDLVKSEWCPEFEQFMRNRLLMGAFRYGLFADPGKGDYDHIGSMIKRLRLFEESGNTEHLVDVANLAMVEFAIGKHPKKHFASVDDGEHCEVK